MRPRNAEEIAGLALVSELYPAIYRIRSSRPPHHRRAWSDLGFAYQLGLRYVVEYSNQGIKFTCDSSMNVASDSESSLNPPASVATKFEIPEGTFVLTYDKLESEVIIQSVQDYTAGATAVFIGTTRNSFQGALGHFCPSRPFSRRLLRVLGRIVTRLEYQAYSKMATKTMKDIFLSIHTHATRSEHAVSSGPPVSPLLRCVVHHRLGFVPVGEASIVIAVSSPHRKEAFVACEYLLEQVKLNVPIWKKEVYENDEPQWKANHPPRS